MSGRLMVSVLAAGIAAAVVVSAQDAASMNKPLAKFTIGDLFPKVASAGLRETSASWKSVGDNARSLASSRSNDIRAALGPVKDQVDKAKSDAKNAEKNRDFAAAGAADGIAKTGQIVVDLLDRLKDVADRQEDAATAWLQAADMMRRFADADDSFDRYRSAGIVRPESGQPDKRLNDAGYNAFKSHSEALKDLGAALSQLGGKLNALGSDRLKFAADLEKGGHIKDK